MSIKITPSAYYSAKHTGITAVESGEYNRVKAAHGRYYQHADTGTLVSRYQLELTRYSMTPKEHANLNKALKPFGGKSLGKQYDNDKIQFKSERDLRNYVKTLPDSASIFIAAGGMVSTISDKRRKKGELVTYEPGYRNVQPTITPFDFLKQTGPLDTSEFQRVDDYVLFI